MLTPHGPIRGFQGENRLLDDDLLPETVSPDAENCDYQKGSIRRRRGFTRLHTNAAIAGGVRFNTDGTNKEALCCPDAGFDFSGDFLVELQVVINAAPSTNITIISAMNSTLLRGWRIVYDYTNFRFQFLIYDSGGTLRTVNSTAGTTPLVGDVQRIAVRRSGTDVTVYRNGAAGTPGTVSGITASFTLVIGHPDVDITTIAGQVADYTLDEVKVYSTAATQDAYPENELAATGYTLPSVAYWKLNETFWNHYDDSSGNRRHLCGHRNSASYTDGLMPTAGAGDLALRTGAATLGGQSKINDNTALEIITNTGNVWTVECWVRLDAQLAADQKDILFVGVPTANGILHLYIDSSLNLYRGYGTTTTHSIASTAADTTYNVVAGTAFHVAVVRNADTVTTYVNGTAVLTTTGATSENGKNPTYNEVYFPEPGAAITIDDLRIWKTARNAYEIARWMNTIYPDVADSNLLAYYRFEASGPEDDSTGNTTATIYTDQATSYVNPSRGIVYPSSPRRMLGLFKYSAPQRGDLARTGANVFKDELLVATHSGLWRIDNEVATPLADLQYPGRDAPFDHAVFKGQLVFGNGIEACRKYDGNSVPTTLTIAGPSTTLTDTPNAGASNGTFTATGTYYYRVSFRNSIDGTESLASPESGGALLAATDDNIDLSSIPVSTNPQVDSRRIYRLDPAGQVYYYLADISDNTTTTYTDTGTATVTTLPVDDLRGDIPGCKYFAVFNNSLIACNSGDEPSGIYFSEADTLNFPEDNLLIAGDGDGDEITGCWALGGACVIFKEQSIYVLTGTGASTFSTQRLPVPGCVAAGTIAEAHNGLYYLGIDNVYRIDASLSVTPIGAMNFMTSRYFDMNKRRLAAGAYNRVNRTYMFTYDATDGRETLVYDEDTQSWAKWDTAFDCYAQEETEDGIPGVLAATNGFVFRLYDGYVDGFPVYGDTETVYTGSVTSNATAIITDGGASFPTTDHGLAGCKVLVVASAGNQERLIIGNTATSLYLDSPLSPSITGTYYVGAIDWYWESKWIDFGDPFDIKALFYTYLFLDEGSLSDITIKWKTDQYETWVSTTFANTDELAQIAMAGRGRRMKFRFEYQKPGYTIGIKSFQPVIARAKSR